MQPALNVYDLYELAVTGALKEEEEEVSEETEGETESAKKKMRSVSGMKRDILFLERCLDLLKSGGRMAIVLPQGNLNNIGTTALRSWIASRARLLAVVGLHVNTFKPFTGTKTSVLFLQKWGGEAGNPINDYEVFMATSHKSGKDNSGRYKYQTDQDGNLIDEEGVPITESGKPAAIDHDLDEIAEGFIEWGNKQGFTFLAEG